MLRSRSAPRAAALICLALTATGAHGGALVEIHAPGYRVIHSGGKEAAVDYLTRIDRFHQALEIALKKPAAPSAIKTQLYVLSPEDYKAFFEPYPDIGGFFAPAEFANYVVVNADEDQQASLRGSFHEYSHYFLSTRYEGINYPAWFHEGFAEVMEGASFDRKHVKFTLPVARILKLREIDWLPLDQVLAVDVDTSQYTERHRLHAFYGQSWALVHHVIHEDKGWDKLDKYLLAVDAGQPVESALRQHLGVGFAGLETQLKEYVRRWKLPTLTVKLPAREPPLIQSIRTLDDEEAALSLAEVALRLMFRKGSRFGDRVQPLLDRVAEDSPLYPRRLALQAMMAGAADDDTLAEEWVKQASAILQPGDATTAKILGYVLLYRIMYMGVDTRTPRGTMGNTLQRSRGFYAMAMRVQPDDLEAIWGFGMASAWANTEVRKAVDLLNAAYAREPRSDYLALALGYGYEQLEREDKALEFWKQAELYARHNNIRNLARKKLGQYTVVE